MDNTQLALWIIQNYPSVEHLEVKSEYVKIETGPDGFGYMSPEFLQNIGDRKLYVETVVDSVESGQTLTGLQIDEL